jgi:hypothetical protein
VIILGLPDTETIQFRIQSANAFKDAQIARLPERFADHFGRHIPKLDHLSA